ncbi:MAG: hypothetical protein L0H64_09785, partial [Pseudonocardia sp.]|nr:hypothetical protein [Pseudonocardia sp.]
HLPPHAPMPGAPPYPAPEELPSPPVGGRAGRSTYPLALVAALVWAAVNVVGLLVVSGLPPSADAVGATVGEVLVTTMLAGTGTWLVARRHPWAFWVLVLVAAPFYWVLRLIQTGGAS